MHSRIDMVGVLTNNIEAMKAFYRDVLGFAVLIDMPEYVEFKNDGVRFSLSTMATMHAVTGHESYATKRAGQTVELAFRVSDPSAVDGRYNDLIAKGATPITPPADLPWNQRAAFFADPDGNIHEIFTDLPSSV